MALSKNMQLNPKKYHMALPLVCLKYLALSAENHTQK